MPNSDKKTDNFGTELYLEELYLDSREAASLLEISEEELRALAKKNQVPTHNIAGGFLRFKKKELEELKIKWRIQRELFPKRGKYFAHDNTVSKAGLFDGIRDFWYFNDFYIMCTLLASALLFFIVSSQ